MIKLPKISETIKKKHCESLLGKFKTQVKKVQNENFDIVDFFKPDMNKDEKDEIDLKKVALKDITDILTDNDYELYKKF